MPLVTLGKYLLRGLLRKRALRGYGFGGGRNLKKAFSRLNNRGDGSTAEL